MTEQEEFGFQDIWGLKVEKRAAFVCESLSQTVKRPLSGKIEYWVLRLSLAF